MALRVLHIGKFFPPYLGGMEVFLADLIHEQRRQGIDAQALVHGDPRPGDPEWVQRVPVQFNLCVRPGTRLEDVRRVLTHPHAAAQCRGWMHANAPWARITEGGSTAAAAEEVADPSSKYDAAICAPVAGERYGLEAVATCCSSARLRPA